MSQNTIKSFHNIVLTLSLAQRGYLEEDIKAVQSAIKDASQLVGPQQGKHWAKREVVVAHRDEKPSEWSTMSYSEAAKIVNKTVPQLCLALTKGGGKANFAVINDTPTPDYYLVTKI